VAVVVGMANGSSNGNGSSYGREVATFLQKSMFCGIQ